MNLRALLKPIIDTIDRFGLKTRFLKKHKLAVTRFYDALLSRKYNTELLKKLRKGSKEIERGYLHFWTMTTYRGTIIMQSTQLRRSPICVM